MTLLDLVRLGLICLAIVFGLRAGALWIGCWTANLGKLDYETFEAYPAPFREVIWLRNTASIISIACFVIFMATFAIR